MDTPVQICIFLSGTPHLQTYHEDSATPKTVPVFSFKRRGLIPSSSKRVAKQGISRPVWAANKD
ncbi:hypothetical protein J6590_000660 [Homalodisca vitripennis]|nr:hypothetical protein J6590_000660 [Homalodisca vitripennis]